jgi:hypothetical protein
MATVYTEVEVDVSLSDFETDDLIEELESRGKFANSGDNEEIIEDMYNLFRAGKRDAIDEHLRTLFYNILGRIA